MRDLNYQLKQLCDRNRDGNCRIHQSGYSDSGRHSCWFIMSHSMSDHGMLLQWIYWEPKTHRDI